jgi:hypothetical protein
LTERLAGEPETGEPETGVAVTDGPGSWACLDWRFMLPVPDLGAVWVAPDCPQEAAALRALGLPVAADGGTADTVVALGATADLSALVARLGGMGLVKLTVTGRPPRAGLFGLVRPWRVWRRRLRSAGLDVVVEAIGLPNAQRATAMVALGQPLALRLALRRQPASRRGRALGRVAEVAVRMGLRQLVCRQGVVVAAVRGGGAG